LTDFTLEPTGKVPREDEATDAPDLRENITVDECEVLDLTVETGNEAELGLCATICLWLYSHEYAFIRCFIILFIPGFGHRPFE
jgi:hypothetical protein